MPRKANKISTRWIRETREAFRDFLDETNFPDPERLGERGPKLKYPEWVIMFIAILSVKLKVKSYVQIHKMAVKYWDIIAKDPEIHPFSLEEVNRILDAVHPWYRPYLTVAFFTGMRAGELNGLSWPDFLMDMQPEPHIFIHRTYVYKKDGVPKTKKSKRYIKCLPQVLDALEEQRKLTENRKHIFLTVDGQRMTPDHIRKEVWTPALEKAGIDYRPPLQTRHTFAAMMMSVGKHAGWVQNMLGHSSLQMIFQRYYAWIPRQTRSDGKAFMRYVKGAAPEAPEKTQNSDAEQNRFDKRCTNLVPLDEYRRKKRVQEAS